MDAINIEDTNVEAIISFIIDPIFTGHLLILKILFIVFSLIFLTGIFYFGTKSSWLNTRFTQDAKEILEYRSYGGRKIIKQWEKIMRKLGTGLESEYKLAVIEADSMLNDILQKMGYGGETLGDRLKHLTPASLANIEQIWQAHKIRNNIVHDPDYRLSLDEARRTLVIYEKAFTDLQAF